MANPPVFIVANKAVGGSRAIWMHFEGYRTTVGQIFRLKKETTWKAYVTLGGS